MQRMQKIPASFYKKSLVEQNYYHCCPYGQGITVMVRMELKGKVSCGKSVAVACSALL
jgi:hypothetical protein